MSVKGKAVLGRNHKIRTDYIIGEDMDLLISERDVEFFDTAWKGGLSLWDIARAIKRDPDEIAVLVIDRRRRGFVANRKNGLWGNQKPTGGD